MYCNRGFTARGEVDFGPNLGEDRLARDERKCWPQALRLDGLTYGDLTYTPARERRIWLGRSAEDTHTPVRHPYRAVTRRAGSVFHRPSLLSFTPPTRGQSPFKPQAHRAARYLNTSHRDPGHRTPLTWRSPACSRRNSCDAPSGGCPSAEHKTRAEHDQEREG